MKMKTNFKSIIAISILSGALSLSAQNTKDRSPAVDPPEPGTSKEVIDKDGNSHIEPAGNKNDSHENKDGNNNGDKDNKGDKNNKDSGSKESKPNFSLFLLPTQSKFKVSYQI